MIGIFEPLELFLIRTKVTEPTKRPFSCEQFVSSFPPPTFFLSWPKQRASSASSATNQDLKASLIDRPFSGAICAKTNKNKKKLGIRNNRRCLKLFERHFYAFVFTASKFKLVWGGKHSTEVAFALLTQHSQVPNLGIGATDFMAIEHCVPRI